MKYDCVIKTREIFNFLPLTNNSVIIELNFCYKSYQQSYHQKLLKFRELTIFTLTYCYDVCNLPSILKSEDFSFMFLFLLQWIYAGVAVNNKSTALFRSDN